MSGYGSGEDHGEPEGHDAAQVVTALYQGHALVLIRLAYIMLGDQQAAEDVGQDAFCGLYRAWPRLHDRGNPLAYVRTSVVNGCRSAHRRARRVRAPLPEPNAASAESLALAGEEQRATVVALNRLPPRQREAIVLHFYACLPEQDVALAMEVSRGTVKSTTARGLATLGRILREEEQRTSSKTGSCGVCGPRRSTSRRPAFPRCACPHPPGAGPAHCGAVTSDGDYRFAVVDGVGGLLAAVMSSWLRICRMSSRPVTYFVVYDRARNISGYTWRIGTHGTSFYIMARYTPLSAVKISLHGPDPRPAVGPPGFKIVIERQALPGAVDAGGAYIGMRPGEAHWFTGRRINDHATHVLTFRSAWDLFRRDLPSGPPPGDVKKTASALIVPAPPQMRAADVDVFVSRRRPYWEHEKRARRDDACLGPMSNESGEYLTAVSYRRSQYSHPAPAAALAPPGRTASISARGLGTALDGRGVLWVVEQWMSEDVFTAQRPGR